MKSLPTSTTKVPALIMYKPTNYVGKFTVIHKSGITKFDILDLAVKYFQSLNEPAAVWDVTVDEKLIASKLA
jgi:hypothetical protein